MKTLLGLQRKARRFALLAVSPASDVSGTEYARAAEAFAGHALDYLLDTDPEWAKRVFAERDRLTKKRRAAKEGA